MKTNKIAFPLASCLLFMCSSALSAGPIAFSFCYPFSPIGAPGSSQIICALDPGAAPVHSSYYQIGQHFLEYNDANGKYHLGEDWNGNGGGSTDFGDPVYAVADGTVVYTRDLGDKKPDSWGKVIVIQHALVTGEAVYSLYAHLNSMTVDPLCDRASSLVCIVRIGQQIATLGDGNGYYGPSGVGCSSSNGCAHLHLEIRKDFSLTDANITPGHGYVADPNDPLVDRSYYNPSEFIEQHRLPVCSASSVFNGGNSSISCPTPLPPSVSTLDATSITQETASLNSSVNPNGISTSIWFEWGNTTNLGNQTPQYQVGSGAASLSVSSTLDGLQCGTIYYYRARGQSAAGGASGNTLSFTTSGCGSGGTQARELITNGDFEQGSSGWTILSGDWHISPPSPPVTPRSGTHAIYLSTAAGSMGNNLTGRFYSSPLNVPSNAVSGQYSFWLNVITTEPSTAAGVDLLHFTVVDASTFTPIVSSWISNQNNTGGSYTFVPFLMDSSLPGRSVRLVFDGTTNQTNPTLFVLDDISFTVNVPTTTTGAPSVSTQDSDDVTPTSARVSMSVNPNGADTTVWFNFEAGNPSPVVETDHVSIGTGQQSVNFSFGVFDLQCDTVYYYRANASNSYGSRQGLVFSFRTDTCPLQSPVARTNPADNTTLTSARLNGAVNPNGFSTNAWFAWGTDTTLGNTTPAQDVGTGNTSVSIAATLNNLQCGTTYYYRAVAQNSGGSDTGALYNFTTASCGPPNVPPTISITAPGAGNATADQSFTVAWNDSDPDNNATITLSYSTTSNCSSPVQIAGNISEDDPTNNYTWNTSTLPAGSYYILATISDGVNPTVSSCSSGHVSVSHAINQSQIFKDGFEAGNFTMWSSMLAHPLVGVWQGTIAGYASTLTIAEDTSEQFSAQASIAQAVQPVESLTILSITETSFDALRPADHNAELRLSLTQSGGEQCLTGDYLDNGSTRPISLCRSH